MSVANTTYHRFVVVLVNMYDAYTASSSSSGGRVVVHCHFKQLRRPVRRPLIAIQRCHGNRVLIRPVYNSALVPEQSLHQTSKWIFRNNRTRFYSSLRQHTAVQRAIYATGLPVCKSAHAATERRTLFISPPSGRYGLGVAAFSGVTRVGDTRGGNWGCHPSIFSWKPGDLFLVASSAVSSLVSSSLFCSKPAGDLFLLIAVTITIAFYCFHSGVNPSRVSPHTFFYLSDLVSPLFFVNLPT